MYLMHFTVSNIFIFLMSESEGVNMLYTASFVLSCEPINRPKVKQIKALNNTYFLNIDLKKDLPFCHSQ